MKTDRSQELTNTGKYWKIVFPCSDNASNNVMFRGYISNRDQVSVQLNQAFSDDTQLFSHALSTWDSDVISHVYGDYLFAIRSSNPKRFTIGLSAGSSHSLYYKASNDSISSSDNLAAFSEDENNTIDLDSLTMLFHWKFIIPPYTFFDGVKQIAPGEVQIWSAHKTLSIKSSSYHDANYYLEENPSLLDSAHDGNTEIKSPFSITESDLFNSIPRTLALTNEPAFNIVTCLTSAYLEKRSDNTFHYDFFEQFLPSYSYPSEDMTHKVHEKFTFSKKTASNINHLDRVKKIERMLNSKYEFFCNTKTSPEKNYESWFFDNYWIPYVRRQMRASILSKSPDYIISNGDIPYHITPSIHNRDVIGINTVFSPSIKSISNIYDAYRRILFYGHKKTSKKTFDLSRNKYISLTSTTNKEELQEQQDYVIGALTFDRLSHLYDLSMPH